MKKAVSIVVLLTAWLLVCATGGVRASDMPTLADYDLAVQKNDISKIRYLRSYILGAVDTHLMFSRMLRDWSSFNALCTGQNKLQANEIGAIFELRIRALRRRYGDDIMGLPIVETIPSIVEEYYRCF